jgi:hypothetical protein
MAEESSESGIEKESMEHATLEDMELNGENKVLAPSAELPQPHKPQPEPVHAPITTHIVDFPQCPVRVGRVYKDDEDPAKVGAVVTCGFREVTLKECLECNYPHSLQETLIDNGKKLVKNAQEIRELKSEVAALKQQVEDLTKILKPT